MYRRMASRNPRPGTPERGDGTANERLGQISVMDFCEPAERIAPSPLRMTCKTALTFREYMNEHAISGNRTIAREHKVVALYRLVTGEAFLDKAGVPAVRLVVAAYKAGETPSAGHLVPGGVLDHELDLDK